MTVDRLVASDDSAPFWRSCHPKNEPFSVSYSVKMMIELQSNFVHKLDFYIATNATKGQWKMVKYINTI